jgi:hypothetical protein
MYVVGTVNQAISKMENKVGFYMDIFNRWYLSFERGGGDDRALYFNRGNGKRKRNKCIKHHSVVTETFTSCWDRMWYRSG